MSGGLVPASSEVVRAVLEEGVQLDAVAGAAQAGAGGLGESQASSSTSSLGANVPSVASAAQ